MGNITKDPEFRVTPQGISICTFTIAINRKYKDVEEVTFVEITSFGDNADRITQWFDKGRPIHVEGRLKLDQWQDKNTGQNRQKLSVILESFQVIAQGRAIKDHSEEQDHSQAQERKPDANTESGGYREEDIDEDVPF